MSSARAIDSCLAHNQALRGYLGAKEVPLGNWHYRADVLGGKRPGSQTTSRPGLHSADTEHRVRATGRSTTTTAETTCGLGPGRKIPVPDADCQVMGSRPPRLTKASPTGAAWTPEDNGRRQRSKQ